MSTQKGDFGATHKGRITRRIYKAAEVLAYETWGYDKPNGNAIIDARKSITAAVEALRAVGVEPIRTDMVPPWMEFADVFDVPGEAAVAYSDEPLPHGSRPLFVMRPQSDSDEPLPHGSRPLFVMRPQSDSEEADRD